MVELGIDLHLFRFVTKLKSFIFCGTWHILSVWIKRQDNLQSSMVFSAKFSIKMDMVKEKEEIFLHETSNLGLMMDNFYVEWIKISNIYDHPLAFCVEGKIRGHCTKGSHFKHINGLYTRKILKTCIQ